jgi:hypothetical protein
MLSEIMNCRRRICGLTLWGALSFALLGPAGASNAASPSCALVAPEELMKRSFEDLLTSSRHSQKLLAVLRSDYPETANYTIDEFRQFIMNTYPKCCKIDRSGLEEDGRDLRWLRKLFRMRDVIRIKIQFASKTASLPENFDPAWISSNNYAYDDCGILLDYSRNLFNVPSDNNGG